MFSLWHNFSIILIFFVTFGRWTFRTQTWTQNGNKEHEARLKGRWEPKLATWNFRFRVPRSKNPTWLERGKFMNTFLIPGFKKYSTFLKLAMQATLQPMLFFKVLRQDSLLSTHQIHSLKLTVRTCKMGHLKRKCHLNQSLIFRGKFAVSFREGISDRQ